MKKSHSLIAIGAGVAVAIAGGLSIANLRTAEATSSTPHFVRPGKTAAGERSNVPDLTLFSAFADEKALKAIRKDKNVCEAALSAAGVSFRVVEPVKQGACGYTDAIEVKAAATDFTPNPGAPKDLPMTCDLAARMELWERHVIIPAAEKFLGSPVVEIKAFGTFQCRNVAETDKLSKHAFAEAADVAGFILADGREITVLDDFRSTGPKGDFLREVHDRACDLFDVTLGPNYNEAHANHFHVDVGGDHACR
jgi:hypothetical protein